MTKCVVFLYSRHDSDQMYMPRGTAFFVYMEYTATHAYSYLVTAKHVIDGLRRTGDHMVYLRVNKPEGGFEWLASDPNHWTSHPSTDEFVDVAVLPAWDPTEIESDISAWFLGSNATAVPGVGPGDDLFITGLFVYRQGMRQSEPIVRVGNIAAMPGEPIPTKLGDMTGYLIEARSIGGLSGSPVFLNTSDGIYLLGLMHGHWDVNVAQDEAVSDDEFQYEAINTGIGIVVPVDKIIEVIEQPMLKKKREDQKAILGQ